MRERLRNNTYWYERAFQSTLKYWKMSPRLYDVILAVVVLLGGVRTGLCVETADTVPESGTVIREVEGTQNINLYCAIRIDDDRVAANWFVETPDDREDGRSGEQVLPADDNFILSGESIDIDINGTITPVPSNTNLTIVSLTGDLQHTIIFCSSGRGKLVNFTLIVYIPPRLSDMGMMTRRENENFHLDMSEAGSHLAFPFPQFMWTRHDGVELVNSTGRTYGYPSITIDSVRPSDSGNYTLTATNYQQNGGQFLGNDTASFSLNVLFGAGLGGSVEPVAVLEGDPATLLCGTDLTGNPLPIVQWTDNSGSIVTSEGRYTLSSGRDVVSLTLDTTARTDTGYWNCTAQVYENGPDSLTVGQPVMRSIHLAVVVAPTAPEDVQVDGGAGSTWVAFSWHQTFEGVPPFSQQVILIGGGEQRNVTIESSNTSTNVTGLLPGTHYTFRVLVVSISGDVQAASPPSAMISATTALTAPGILCLEQPTINDTNLVIFWSYTPQTNALIITETRVEYRAENSPVFIPLSSYMSESGSAASGSGEVIKSDTSISFPLPVAGENYFFRVTASNEAGSTTTMCPNILLTIGVPATPNIPELISQYDDRVNLTLSTNHSGVDNATIDNFQFLLHVNDMTSDSVAEDIAVSALCRAGGGECNLSHLISHLSITHTYNITVSAQNRYGTSDTSPPLTIKISIGTSLLLIIGLSIGGGVVLVVALILLVMAVWVVRRKTGSTGSYETENIKKSECSTTSITLSHPQQQTPQDLSQTVSLTAQQCETPEPQDQRTNKQAYYSPLGELLNMPVVDDGLIVGSNDSYELMDGQHNPSCHVTVGGDATIYDVPRCPSQGLNTCDNTAASFEIPAYVNTNFQELQQ